MGVSPLVSSLVLTMLIGCAEKPREQSAGSEQEASKMQEKQEKKSWSAGSCTGIDHLKELDGLTGEKLEETLGTAGKKDSFLRGERQEEFHVLLENTYPLKKEGNAEVPLREWTWTEGKCKLTVWLHQVNGQWTAFENSRYSATAQF